MFTLAVAARNPGFLAIRDWLSNYSEQLKKLFNTDRLPSYSTIRRTLLETDYQEYSARLAQFFDITLLERKTMGLDGKILKSSYLLEKDNLYCETHPAIISVSAYLVERGLILKPHQVDYYSNE
ncbi:hypothetical protein IQ238_20110 [Pleurocapsales cyanobacterium LEGE 06147]|nr:hypothetical protein [Pleurocapsales cyanobacterium LEGE 06147]